MRKDLMEAVLGAASAILFAPAVWIGPFGPKAVRVYQGGGDVEFTMFSEDVRRATHWFRGLKSEFDGLAAGQDIMVEGHSYQVIDKRTPIDAPLEWEIAAKLVA